MPRQYTANDADKAVRQFLDERCLDEETFQMRPLDEWTAEGPNRFVHHEDEDPNSPVDCTVEFDDDYHASVHLLNIFSGDVCIREIE
jgi:hypothetical protein